MKTMNEAFTCRPSVTALAVCAALAAMAGPTLAEPLQQVTLYRSADMSRWSDNYVEFGGLINETIPVGTPNSTYKFGEFSGLSKDGLYGIVNFNWITRQEGDDSQYSQVYGENVGLSSKFLLDAGHQSHWRMLVGVDRLVRHETDSAKFIHDGLGTDTLTLPTCSGVSFQTANVTNIPASCFKGYDIKQEREIYRASLEGDIGRGWGYKVSYREDRREGSRLTGIYGNKMIIVPYPIDDQTYQLEPQLSFTSKDAQLQLSYNYSKYVNQYSALDVKDPFTGARTDLRMSLMPGNEQHHVMAIGGYNVTRLTRLTAQASYAVGLQNDPFLPYTTNTTTPSLGAAPMPRSSLEGKVINSLVDLGLTTTPVSKMNLKLGYQFRETDNRTPMSQYVYASRDGAQLNNPALVNPPTAGALAANSASRAQVRTNAPLSTREHKATADADYEIFSRTLLRTALEYNNTHYELADRAYTNTGKATVELRRPISATFLGNVGYTFIKRTGSDYDKRVFLVHSYTDPNYQSSFQVDSHPSSRTFMWADYNENRVRTSGTWTATETFTMQAGVDAYHVRYRGPGCAESSDGINNTTGFQTSEQLPDTCLGRSFAEGGSANLDFQFQHEENLATFAFANLSQSKTQMHGRQWSRLNTSTPPTGADERRDFFVDAIYRDMAFGVGVKFQPEKWDLGAQYVYSRGIGKNETFLPANTTTTPNPPVALPDTEARVHSVQLYAKWNYSKEVTWRFNYWIERLMAYDWAYDGVSPTSNGTGSAMFTGQGSPNYWNHVFGVSVALSSW